MQRTANQFSNLFTLILAGLPIAALFVAGMPHVAGA
jgi:hypothetical protein